MRVSSNYLLFVFSGCFTACLTAGAQTHSIDPLGNMLTSLRAEAAIYSASLPSISCSESIRVTSPIFLRPRKITEASAEITVRRDDSKKASLQEFRRFTELNGHASASVEPVSLPMLLNGGFVEGLKIFLSSEVARCMTYRLGEAGAGPDGSTRITFARNSSAGDQLCTRVMPGLTGYALIHPDGQHVLHVERTIPSELATLNHVAAFTAVDYASVSFGDASFWLPSHVTSFTGQKEITWDASYTACHRFTVTTTIVPIQRKIEPQVASVH